jgi:crotonobetainyl-CoA:carnitine CoA-transferase CaiB-like acyl-CoA transferase
MPPLPVADLAAGMTAAFGICAAILGRDASGVGSYLDISMTDVLATWTGPTGAGASGGAAAGPTPGYGLFGTADGGQVALGVVNEQHFWSALCGELALGQLAGLDFDERSRRGDELQRAVAGSIATRERDPLVAGLAAAGVPAAPVLDRRGMLATAPFPPFPIRLPLPETAREVPTLDQHRGQGFSDRTAGVPTP